MKNGCCFTALIITNIYFKSINFIVFLKKSVNCVKIRQILKGQGLCYKWELIYWIQYNIMNEKEGVIMNREDFPMLKQDLIYFDNGATSLKPQVVIDKMTDYYMNYSANAHRGDYDISYKVDLE